MATRPFLVPAVLRMTETVRVDARVGFEADYQRRSPGEHVGVSKCHEVSLKNDARMTVSTLWVPGVTG
jgi:hypothetical protein